MLCTGDIGFIDDEGYLYITGRRSEFAKICGKRINYQQIYTAVKERWGMDIICRERDEKLEVVFEEAEKERAVDIADWLAVSVGIGRHNVTVRVAEKFERSDAGKLKMGNLI